MNIALEVEIAQEMTEALGVEIALIIELVLEDIQATDLGDQIAVTVVDQEADHKKFVGSVEKQDIPKENVT